MNRYTYRAEWSREYDEYVARCIELPFLTHWAPTLRDAIAGVEQAVDERLAEDNGESVPPPITDRKFSGNILVRTSPSLHARLAVEAADQHVSMNHWMVQKLADRPPSSLLDW